MLFKLEATFVADGLYFKFSSDLCEVVDVSSSTNYAFAMDFFGTKFFSFSNNQPGSNVLVNNVSNCLRLNNFKYVVFLLVLVKLRLHHLMLRLS